MIGWLDRLLSAVPHKCVPRRHYTLIGWAYRCEKWYCSRIAPTEVELLGGKNEDAYLDIRRRAW